MAYLRTSRTRSRGLRVPSRITGINYASPLTEGLQAALPATFDLPIGFDLVSGAQWTVNGSPDRYWAGRNGVKVPMWGAYDSLVNSVSIQAPSALTTNWPTSEGTALVWFWRHPGSTSRGSVFKLGSPPNRTHYIYYEFDEWYDDAFSTTRTGPHSVGTAYHLGTECTLVGATFAGGTKKLYALDASKSNEVTTQTGLTFGLNTQLLFGHGSADGGSNGSTGGILLLDTALDRDTMVNARSWFWDAFNPRPEISYFIPAAAGGGATTDVPLTMFSVSPQAPTTLRSLISNVPTL